MTSESAEQQIVWHCLKWIQGVCHVHHLARLIRVCNRCMVCMNVRSVLARVTVGLTNLQCLRDVFTQPRPVFRQVKCTFRCVDFLLLQMDCFHSDWEENINWLYWKALQWHGINQQWTRSSCKWIAEQDASLVLLGSLWGSLWGGMLGEKDKRRGLEIGERRGNRWTKLMG